MSARTSHPSHIEPVWSFAIMVLLSTILVIFAIQLDILFYIFLVTLLFLAGILVVVIFLKRRGSLLLIYVLGLPPYTLTMALLYKYSGSMQFIRAIQPWKEVIAISILLLIFLTILLKTRSKPLHTLDLLIFLYLGLNILYLFTPGDPDLAARLYGLRANAFFVVIYLLGRMFRLKTKQQKLILQALVVLGVTAGVFVLVEFIALPPNWPAKVGLMDYLKAFYNVSPVGHYGLTWTFETSNGLRRYSAFFADPLELASSTLITGPAALYVMYVFRPRTWGRAIATGAFGLIVLSLLLSISRASLLAFFFEMLAITFWLKKPRLRLFLLLIAVIGLVGLITFADPGLTDFIWQSITFQNPSSQGHISEWLEGARAMISNPLGLGLGQSGQVGSRFGNQIGGENQFVIVGVQLGLLGLGLYLIIFLLSIFYSLRAFNETSGTRKALSFIAAASKFGLLFPALTANIETYVFAMFVTWWLVGFSIQQLQSTTNQHENLPRFRIKALNFENSH